MKDINLLPKPAGKKGERLYFTLLWRWTMNIFLFFAVTSVTMLLLGKLTIQETFTQLAEQLATLNQKAPTFNKEIQIINTGLARAYSLIKTQNFPSLVLAELTGLLPDGIILHSFQYEEDIITLKGEASRREDLLKLQEQIDKNKKFDVDLLPLEQLLKKTDVPFTLVIRVFNL